QDPEARLAIDLFCYRVRKYVGAYLAVLEGAAEAIVFTGGIGEHSSVVRGRIVAPFAWAGVALGEDGDWVREERISRAESRLAVWVIPTREEELIARETARLLSA
ncbi:MAG TPA: acetate kinase, partial [Gemmatimonadales bacterium]|nr:acetate kinase [Gemmatimonadales bacterium]